MFGQFTINITDTNRDAIVISILIFVGFAFVTSIFASLKFKGQQWAQSSHPNFGAESLSWLVGSTDRRNNLSLE
jgi:hypothetical protein